MTVKYNGHFRISLIVGQILFPLPWMNNRAESTVLDFFNPVFKGGRFIYLIKVEHLIPKTSRHE